jgi:hydroxymethylpyrimidine pyrophosphatase-like HAD family hydrolase
LLRVGAAGDGKVQIRAIATDYDGTIAEDDVVPASTLAALARFSASGRSLVLVTGRHLPDLKSVFAGLSVFDVVVAENGGLLYFPRSGTVQTLAPPPSGAFVERLRQRGVTDLLVGQTIVASTIDHHATIRRTIAELGLDLAIILNTDAVMVLPPGIDKASGLRAALASLSLPAESVAAIGDAENDIVFLAACGHAVAVANALPQVKAVAHTVTAGSRGAGMEEFIAGVLGDADRFRLRTAEAAGRRIG